MSNGVEKLAVPAWILAMAALLFTGVFLISIFLLDEPRFFYGKKFGPDGDSPSLSGKIEIEDLTSHETANGKVGSVPTSDHLC